MVGPVTFWPLVMPRTRQSPHERLFKSFLARNELVASPSG
jgi:hypothetical protein